VSRRFRRSALSPLSCRLTPTEVAQLWFRRGTDYAEKLHSEHPTFPQPGPDGLYLAAQVSAWFDNWHGAKAKSGKPDFEAEILEMIRGGSRSNSTPSK
jgi:hypothetical protein